MNTFAFLIRAVPKIAFHCAKYIHKQESPPQQKTVHMQWKQGEGCSPDLPSHTPEPSAVHTRHTAGAHMVQLKT